MQNRCRGGASGARNADWTPRHQFWECVTSWLHCAIVGWASDGIWILQCEHDSPDACVLTRSVSYYGYTAATQTRRRETGTIGASTMARSLEGGLLLEGGVLWWSGSDLGVPRPCDAYRTHTAAWNLQPGCTRCYDAAYGRCCGGAVRKKGRKRGRKKGRTSGV